MPAHILIVDDSPTILNLLGSIIRRKGHRVTTAGDGLQGLEAMGRDAPDLVITDVNMPFMDGLTFVSKLRANEAWTTLPVIVLSTEAQDKDRQAALDAGASLYLIKPIPPHELVAHVEGLLTQG